MLSMRAARVKSHFRCRLWWNPHATRFTAYDRRNPGCPPCGLPERGLCRRPLYLSNTRPGNLFVAGEGKMACRDSNTELENAKRVSELLTRLTFSNAVYGFFPVGKFTFVNVKKRMCCRILPLAHPFLSDASLCCRKAQEGQHLEQCFRRTQIISVKICRIFVAMF